MASYEKFTQQVGIIGLAEILLNLKSLVIIPLVTKLLGASDYGVLAQVSIILMWLAPVHGAGLGTAMTRFLAPETDKGKIQEGFYTILVTRVSVAFVLALMLFSLATPIANTFFKGSDARPIIQLAAAIITFDTSRSLCFHYFLVFRQIRTYTILRLADGFGWILLMVGMVLAGWGIFGVVLANLIVTIVGGGVAFSLVVRRIGIKRPHFAPLKQYLKFGSPFSAISFLRDIGDYSDRYVIGYFLGVASVGVYAVAASVGKWVNELVYIPLSQILLPALSQSYDQGKTEEVRNYLRYSTRYYLMVAIPGLIGLSLLGRQVLDILSTKEISSVGYPIIPLVALSTVLYGGVYALFAGQVLKLMKKTQILTPIWGLATLVNLGLNVVLIPRFGIVAAAASTLLSYVLAVGLTLYFACRYWKYEIDWSFIGKSLAASAVMSLAILLLRPSQIWEVLLAVVLGVAIYVSALYLLGGLQKKEIVFFYQVAKKSLRLAKAPR